VIQTKADAANRRDAEAIARQAREIPHRGAGVTLAKSYVAADRGRCVSSGLTEARICLDGRA
jgi:hypothetical protein